MHYLSRFTETSSARIAEIVDLHWNGIRDRIHLIASACYPFPEVMKSLSEPVCVFPIEGLPGDRYFPGTEVMDRIENTSEHLIRRLFNIGPEYSATVQPHSGTQANQIVFNAVLGHEDSVLSLSPGDGGHISHKVLIGRRNPVVFYPLGYDHRIDYEKLSQLAADLKPRLIVAGGSSYPREIDFSAIGKIAHDSGAILHADISHTATFVAAGVHASVFPYADYVTFNMIKNLRGPNGGILIYRSAHRKKVQRALFPDTQGGPNENTMFAKLVALDQLTKMDLNGYASRMVAIAKIICSVLQAEHRTVVTGGTDSHQILVDLRSSGITGIEAEKRCELSGVLLNRNLVAGDHQPASISSGVRMGTACLAILNYTDSDTRKLAHWLAKQFSPEPLESDGLLIEELTRKYNYKLLPETDPH